MRQVRTPGLERIVGRHLHIWEIRRQVARRRDAEAAAEAPGLGPYITISRLPWAEGDAVARRVADRLGWELFDRELVNFIARDAKTYAQFVACLDEKSRRAMDDWIQTTLDGASLGHLRYLRHLKRVLITVALHGNVVILGRGANFVLPAEAGLRVLVTGSEKQRRQRLAAVDDLSSRQAAKALRREDGRRLDFLRTHFAGAAREMEHYDLVISTDMLGVEAAATVITDTFYTLDRRSLPYPPAPGGEA
ncbi:MAG: cytidylate kinase-like family protein [Candidatus Krumholzibacteriota bacterium]|nr:cytidylate kinase-like family protein [Candidatus Krumholzibacteriota bacterium]